MPAKFYPMKRGFLLTSPFRGPGRPYHDGIDMGWEGGSANLPVYAAQGGTVIHSGTAQGFGFWVVIDHPTEDGSGTTVYGHIIPEVKVGQRVEAGQRIARINPDRNTNGNVAPHLHFEWHRWVWTTNDNDRLDPWVMLEGAAYPGEAPVVPVEGLTPDSLAEAMGNSLTRDRYRELFPTFRDALIQADCTTVERAAMFCAQIGHESMGLYYMEEIHDGSNYEGRRDLGNVHPGDGRRFKGRGPIQVTGRYNYTRLSQWAHSKGYVPTPTYFVDNPHELAQPKYGFLGAVWYWTVERPQINSLCDKRDLDAVTIAINGGKHGIDHRRTRYERCLRLGTRILPTLTTEEEDGVAKRPSLIDGSKQFEGTEFDQWIDYHVNHIREENKALKSQLDKLETLVQRIAEAVV